MGEIFALSWYTSVSGFGFTIHGKLLENLVLPTGTLKGNHMCTQIWNTQASSEAIWRKADFHLVRLFDL